MKQPFNVGQLVAGFLLLVLLTGCATAAPETPTPEPTPSLVPPTSTPIPPTATPIDPLAVGDPARGRLIYETGAGIISEACIECHKLEEGASERKAPLMVGISERAHDRAPNMGAIEYLRESILDPSAYLVEGWDDKMSKSYALLLSDEDIDDLVAFMLTQ